MNVCVKLTVKGRVQGVGFRWFVLREAQELGLKGYVKNLYNDDVEIVVEGNRNSVEELIDRVKKGPAFSIVTHVELDWKEYSGKFTSFNVEF
ncbi:MAG: acylphosphatase [bacterium]